MDVARGAEAGVVTVNGIVIAAEAIERERARLPRAQRASVDAPTLALRAAIARELLRQEAARLDALAIFSRRAPTDPGHARAIEASEESRLRELVDQAIGATNPDPDQCRGYYEAHRERYRGPTRHEFEHILVAAPAAGAGRELARRKAQVLIQRLALAPERFADFARVVSAAPSAADGGRAGAGPHPPELMLALTRMSPGLHSTPIETREGFHVVRLRRSVPGDILPFAQVRAHIAARLHAQARAGAARGYLASLASRASIVVQPSAVMPPSAGKAGSVQLGSTMSSVNGQTRLGNSRVRSMQPPSA